MRYGVVPAGGLGLRSGLPHSKELSLVAGIPVIEYIFDRLVIGGINQIFVTIHSDKKDLIEYLTARSPHKGIIKLVVGERKGLFDGIVSPATSLDKDDEIYFGLPDTVWYPEDSYRTLSTANEKIVLGLLPTDTPSLYGSVNVVGDRAMDIIEKPISTSSPWIWAFGMFKVGIVPELTKLSHDNPAFTNVLGSYTRIHPIKVVTHSSGIYFDTGTPAGLLATNEYVQK